MLYFESAAKANVGLTRGSTGDVRQFSSFSENNYSEATYYPVM